MKKNDSKEAKRCIMNNKKSQPPAPGIYYDVPFSEYLSWDAFSKSKVRHIIRSPKHLEEAESADKETDAMRFGTIVDTMLFDLNWRDKIGVLPETYLDVKSGKLKPFTLASSACKAILCKLEASKEIVCKHAEYQKALSVYTSIVTHSDARQRINECVINGYYQLSIVWVDNETGATCKGRFDMLTPGVEAVDLKTTTDASPDVFSKKIYDLDYHVQAAMYLDGYQQLTGDPQLPWRFIVAESSPPHAVATYELDEQSIEVGRQRYKKAAALWVQYKQSGKARGYSEFCEPISIPTWAIMRNMDQEVADAL